MSAKDILARAGESVTGTATVKSVFGEPIHAEGKTIVPVAKIGYGFGAGGSRHDDGGGGGGAAAWPAGVLEITSESTRFIPYFDVRWLAGAFATGVVLSRLLLRRR
jgi:uncharacterized spore protein YtfJ